MNHKTLARNMDVSIRARLFAIKCEQKSLQKQSIQQFSLGLGSLQWFTHQQKKKQFRFENCFIFSPLLSSWTWCQTVYFVVVAVVLLQPWLFIWFYFVWHRKSFAYMHATKMLNYYINNNYSDAIAKSAKYKSSTRRKKNGQANERRKKIMKECIANDIVIMKLHV